MGLETDIRYILQATYDDKKSEHSFSFNLTSEESWIRSDQAIQEGNLIINPDEPQPELVDQTASIPQWVDNIFVMYAQKQITQNELISALQYLISIEILRV